VYIKTEKCLTEIIESINSKQKTRFKVAVMDFIEVALFEFKE